MNTRSVMFTIVLIVLSATLGAWVAGTLMTSRPLPTVQPTTSAGAPTTPTSGSGARPTIAPSVTPAAQPTALAPTAAEAHVPAFAAEPRQGGFGTAVSLRGWNFSVNAPVSVGLGFPSDGPRLTTISTDQRGAWRAQITIPELQVSPGPDWSLLHIVIRDAHETVLASAPFTFVPAVGPTLEGATQTVHDLLSAYKHGGDVRVYLDSEPRAALDAGQSLDQALGLQPSALTSFTVGAPLDRPSEVLFVPATLTYSAADEQRIFTLVVVDGQWRVRESFIDVPVEPPTRENAPQTVRALLASFGGGTEAVYPYVSTNVRASIEAGRPAHELLGLPPMAWTSFTVGEPLDAPSEVLFVPATLVYPTFTEERHFTLVVEEQQWRVTGSAVVQDEAGAVSLFPVGSDGTPWQGPQWSVAKAGDFNNDGLVESLFYQASGVI